VGSRFAELITYLCPLNVFFFQVTDVIGDEGLRVVGRSCKMMRRLVVLHNDAGFITQHGLVGVAIGCHLLEKLIFYSADMNSEAMAILARSCPRLTDVRLCHVQKYHASYPVIELEGDNTLNEGIRALLQGCRQVRRLALCFCSKFGLSNVVVTEEGIRYIGEYGANLHMLTLTNCGSGNGESLSYIARGCLQLCKLELLHCTFTDKSESPPTAIKSGGLFCSLNHFVVHSCSALNFCSSSSQKWVLIVHF
jgi:hypothetical protein